MGVAIFHKFVLCKYRSIGFEQLLKMVKELPLRQRQRLKLEMEREENDPMPDLEALLLNGPTATKQQLETIEKNRKAVSQWR
jgi:hypothetical protein